MDRMIVKLIFFNLIAISIASLTAVSQLSVHKGKKVPPPPTPSCESIKEAGNSEKISFTPLLSPIS